MCAFVTLNKRLLTYLLTYYASDNTMQRGGLELTVFSGLRHIDVITRRLDVILTS